MSKEELREKLAAIEHERWADWQKYLFSKCTNDGDDNLVIAEMDVRHWDRQIKTPYSDLTAKEQESDMNQVDRYWHLIEQYIEEQS